MVAKKLLYNIRIIFFLVKYNFKNLVNYKKDFLVGFFVVMINTAISLIYIEVLYNNITNIGNWEKYEVILLYSIASLSMAVYSILYGNYRNLKKYIFNGELEIMMTKPLDIILYLRVREFSVQPIVNIIVYMALFLFSLNQLNKTLNFIILFKIIGLSILGILFVSSIALISLSALFYTRYTYTPYDSIMMTLGLANYPINIFSEMIRNILLTVFPIVLIGYLPANTILLKDNIFTNKVVIIITLIYCLISKKIFKIAIKKYDGLGN